MEYPERTLKILEILSEKDYVSSRYLAEKTQVSSRTIYNDVTAINSDLKAVQAEIISKPRYGMKLLVKDTKRFREYVNDLRNTCQKEKDRVQYIIARLLSENSAVKIEDLCEEMYISRSTFQNELKKVRKLLKTYSLSIGYKPYEGMRILGEEKDIRRVLAKMKRKELIQKTVQKEDGLALIGESLKSILKEYQYHISEIAFHSLVTHLYITIRRIENGNILDKEYHPMDKSVIGKEELLIAEQIIISIEEKFDIKFTQKELDYIMIQLKSKKTITKDDNTVISSEIYDMVMEILEEIYHSYHIDLRHDFELITFLAMHLVPLGIRLIYGLTVDNPILEDIRENYPLAYEMAHVAGKRMQAAYGKELPEDELAYIALYLNVAIERYTKKREKKFNLLVVCATGRGSAQMLIYQMKDRFGERINEIFMHESRNLDDVNFDNIDYVLTTVKIDEVVPVPIIEFKNLFQKDSDTIFRDYLKENKQKEVLKLFHPALFFSGIRGKCKEEVLKEICERIAEVKGTEIDLYEMVMKREEMGSTYFGNRIAIPHPYKTIGKESIVSISVLDQPVEWNDGWVQLIIMISMRKDGDQELRLFYKTASKLIMNKSLVDQLIKNPTWENLILIIEELAR